MPTYSNGSSTINFNDDDYARLQYIAEKMGLSVEDVLNQSTGFKGILTGVSGASTSNGSTSPLAQMADDYGIPYNSSTSDMLTEHYLNEQSAEKAWDRTVFAAQHQHQWAVNDLKAAGLNPFLALSGSGSSPTSPVSSVSGGSITSRANTKANNQTDLIRALITSLGSIIGLALVGFGKK